MKLLNFGTSPCEDRAFHAVEASGNVFVILTFHTDVRGLRQRSNGHNNKPKTFKYIKAVFDGLSHPNYSESLPNLLAYYTI